LSVTIEIYGADEVAERLENAADELQQEVEVSLANVLDDIAEYARSIAPKRTGNYAGSIQVVQLGPMEFGLTADAEYAAIIEFGSAPHDIFPVTAKVLAFEVNGEQVFAKYVHHPGTMPQMILHTAIEDNHDAIVEAVRIGVEAALSR
jgi:hypothetical protein